MSRRIRMVGVFDTKVRLIHNSLQLIEGFEWSACLTTIVELIENNNGFSLKKFQCIMMRIVCLPIVWQFVWQLLGSGSLSFNTWQNNNCGPLADRSAIVRDFDCSAVQQPCSKSGGRSELDWFEYWFSLQQVCNATAWLRRLFKPLHLLGGASKKCGRPDTSGAKTDFEGKKAAWAPCVWNKTNLLSWTTGSPPPPYSPYSPPPQSMLCYKQKY